MYKTKGRGGGVCTRLRVGVGEFVQDYGKRFGSLYKTRGRGRGVCTRLRVEVGEFIQD